MMSYASGLLVIGCVLSVTLPAAAGDHAVLLRMLREGHDFRVRAQAALALGRRQDPALARPLEAALFDRHHGVRAAAATALGRLGSASSLPALRRAVGDVSREVRERAREALKQIDTRARRAAAIASTPKRPSPQPHRVSWRSVRYAVHVGNMHNQSGLAARALPALMSHQIAQGLREMKRVAVLSGADAGPRSEVTRRNLPAFRVEGTLTSLSFRQVGNKLSVRAEVSLLVMDQSERTIRSMLRGAATAIERRSGSLAAQRRKMVRQVLQPAVRSALANARKAMDTAAARNGATASAERWTRPRH